jgi:AraC family transcriptional regulator, regulatory protein of adaptative response / methylated-DNA-[protein]-cysteine methyltransferase
MIYSMHIDTKIGKMVALATEEGICLLEFTDMQTMEHDISLVSKQFSLKISEESNSILLMLESELIKYFNGNIRQFTVPIQTIGTNFQKIVWEQLKAIPYGATKSYLEMSTELNNPKAIRAIAQANARNKIYIIVPCHRVIAADGKLTGYGGGLWRKQYLLDLERGQKMLLI